jgi:hypothetical protein
MKIYRHFAENETLRYTFLYTFTPGREEVIQKLKSIEGEGIIIFDTFPEINSETVELEEILSVVTQSGQEMFIPAGIEVEFVDVSRVLFGCSDSTFED